MVDLKYIHHSAFYIKTDGKGILFDPWIDKNAKFNWKEEQIDDILLTHAHGDHLGNAVEIAKEKNIQITTVFETAKYLEKEYGVKTKSIGLGAWISYPWGRAVFLPAFHSNSLPDGSYGGVAASIIIDVDGVRIFHAGDTCLTGEMKTIKELYSNESKKDIKQKLLFKLEQKQNERSKVEYNKLFLHKTIQSIFSDNISTKYSRYNPEHNKELIKKLMNEEDETKRLIFQKIFHLTFIDCLNHFRGRSFIKELAGMKNFDVYIKENNFGENSEEYQNILKFFFLTSCKSDFFFNIPFENG